MALIKCPECKKKISDEAYACIHCGYPLRKDMVIAQVPIIKLRQLSDDKWNEMVKRKNEKATS